MAEVNRVIFQCDDVGLVNDFKDYCKDHRMTLSGMLRKKMYEAVARHKHYEKDRFFSSISPINSR